MLDYDITTDEPMYKIQCQGCEKCVRSHDEEEVAGLAQKAGFMVLHTPEDGTLNFCIDCSTT